MHDVFPSAAEQVRRSFLGGPHGSGAWFASTDHKSVNQHFGSAGSFVVFAITVVFGTLMYMVESPEAGFTSIPRSIYWAIVTLTTVGYGDIAPQTIVGQALASFIMILGYGIIAVPTGIVSAEMVRTNNDPGMECMSCHATGHLDDARFCRKCGAKMPLQA